MTKKVPSSRILGHSVECSPWQEESRGNRALNEEGRSVYVAVTHTWTIICADDQLSLSQVLLYIKYHH